MTWSPTLYLQFADAEEARTVLETALSTSLPEGDEMTGGRRRHFAVAPIEEWVTRPTYERVGDQILMTDPGELRDGYWAMVRLRVEWPGYASALAAIEPYAQALDAPCNVFAGDDQ